MSFLSANKPKSCCPKKYFLQVLTCHRLLLAASSPLLSSCLAATDSWPEDRSCVVLPDFTAEEVTPFVPCT